MIRQFRTQDASPCCNLIHKCLAADSTLSSRLREHLQKSETPESILERARLFYVVVYEIERNIVGIAGLDLNEIRILCVDPEHRRKRIGNALLEAILNMVPGVLFPDLFVYSSVEGKEFYRSCGFVEKGPVSFEVDDEQILTTFMALPLR